MSPGRRCSPQGIDHGERSSAGRSAGDFTKASKRAACTIGRAEGWADFMDAALPGLSGALSFLPYFLPPYVAALAMPSWRWLVAYVLLAPLAAHFGMRATIEEHNPRALIGLVLLFVLTWFPALAGFAAGVLVRCATLVLAARGASLPQRLTVGLLGAALSLLLFDLALAVRR
jgi:hypothetical protein